MSTKSLLLLAFSGFLSTVAFADDKPVSKPICCEKHAECCSVKSPCCGKTIELEIVR